MNFRFTPIPVFTVIFFLLATDTVPARQNTLFGSIALSQDYDSNIDRTAHNEESEWTTTLSPAMSITSEGMQDSFFLRYAPGLVYNHRTNNDRIDHDLRLVTEVDFTRNLNVSLQNTFIKSEDPYDDEESGIRLSDKRGKNRYWTNRVQADLKYTFARESFLEAGYSHQVLDNKGMGEEDYKKHNPYLSTFYSFTTQWQGKASYSYINADFDQSDDLEIKTVEGWLFFRQTEFSKISGYYSYSDINYDGVTDDYAIHTPALGWEHSFDDNTSIGLVGGVSFLERDAKSDREDFFYILAFNKKLKRAAIDLSGKGGYDQQLFNGTEDEDLSRYWFVRGGLNYQLLKDLDSGIYAKYREDKYIDRQPEQDEETLETGATLTWLFSRWYSVSVRYVYTRLDADIEINEYDDHRLFLEIKAGKDLLKW